MKTASRKTAVTRKTTSRVTAPLASPSPVQRTKASPVRVAPQKPAAGPKSASKKLSDDARKAPKPKEKLVRDSFTMPSEDFALIAALKNRALMFKRPAKKSELLRAGLHALQALSAPALRAALDALTPLKAGRPKREAS
ncbi:hypothetical protein EAH83_14710 [Variovorax ginsengisoli]|uniref:Uncharacterized protein n=1 Tax=Variovorax guangxiensis TaxID=1775474 RepID=A0A502DUV0_9BURK|nr:hypothetical protein EAH83_14710 [Variovorax ginsengisoli]TPG27996.1 hypothetical protein EAH82_14370 [Variovorax guangxiensis]